MFIKWNHNSIRITGRWDRRSEGVVTTTNTGGIIEIAYYGQLAVLHFDIENNEHPYPHIWIQVDNGPRIEATVEPYIHIQTTDHVEKLHYLKVIYKSSVEQQHRWYSPLIGKLSFKGVEVEKYGLLADDNRKLIEFVGDSITEGVLIDVECGENCQRNRVFHDDVCATYAWLTAEKLNLMPRIMGYGAVGATKSGQGSVPKASLAYPYVYDGCHLNEEEPDFILINHGANDMFASAENYTKEYFNLLKVIRNINPNSKIICLSAFVGVYPDELQKVIDNFNKQYQDSIIFIDSKGWIPREPLHPLRDGHKIIAEKLTEELRHILFK